MTIRLRPHHLLCMLTFIGKGYTPEFVAQFEAVLSRVATGDEPIQIVEGPDDICLPLLADSTCHCHDPDVLTRDRQAAAALRDLLQLPLDAGSLLFLSAEKISLLREAFAQGTIRTACDQCSWKPTCDAVTQDQFRATLLVRQDTVF